MKKSELRIIINEIVQRKLKEIGEVGAAEEQCHEYGQLGRRLRLSSLRRRAGNEGIIR